ncbi:MAG: hypothetical protein Q4P15_00690 [Propionibacteriaceae bacterium]|nr:hypothetical protein [Propionibacteriaceae bacterium]
MSASRETSNSFLCQVVQSWEQELVFWSRDGEPVDRPMVDSDVIDYMLAREKSPQLF